MADMLGLSIKLTKQQLNRIQLNAAAYWKATQRGRRRSLSRVGAFVRRRGRSLIGTPVGQATKPRPAGKPARARKGARRDFRTILFDVQGSAAVVIGPEAFNSRSGIVPEIQERGGSMRIHEVYIPVTAEELARYQGLFGAAKASHEARLAKAGQTMDGRWVAVSPRAYQRAKWREKRIRTVSVPARPFMGPALEHEMKNDKLAKEFRDILGPIRAAAGYSESA